MTMIQRKFYLPEEMYSNLMLLAKASRKTITQTLRELIEEGIHRRQKERTRRGAEILLALAEKEGWSGAPDLSINHDKYFVKTYEEIEKRKNL